MGIRKLISLILIGFLCLTPNVLSSNFSTGSVGANKNLATDGFIEISGLFIQWGSDVSTSDGDELFDFDIAFPNEVYAVVVTRTLLAVNVLPVTATTLTQFTINRTDSIDGSENFNWIAVGS